MHLVFADVVWPALLLERRILTWWAILIGLIVEYFVVCGITNMSLSRAAFADIAMNAASTVLGLVLIPIVGVAWEIFPGSLIYRLFNVGTFNPGGWLATVVIAAALNTFIERWVLRRYFGQPVIGKRRFWLLFAGNAISIAVALGSIIYSPPWL